MKKIALIFTLLMFTAGMLFGAALSEGFEGTFPPTDWTNTTISGHAWSLSTTTSHTGSNSAKYAGSWDGPYEGELITPRLDLTQSGSDELTFWIKNTDYWGDQNVCKVYISTDGQSTWDLLATYDMDIAVFVEKTLDLETGISQTDNAYVKFWGQDNHGYGVYIDDVAGPGIYEIAGAPGAPTNPSPADDATGIANSGDITWDFGTYTDTYDLWFGEAGSMAEVVTGATAGATVSFLCSGLSYSTEYEWQVIAHNSTKATTDGPVWSFTTLLPASVFQVGGGTTTGQHLPIYPYFGYSYSQSIYLASDFGTPGPGSDKRIEKIWYNYSWNGGDEDSDTWVVYMNTTANTNLDAGYEDISGFTQVFSGDLDLELVSGDGWIEIILDIPFAYDPASDGNLVVAVDENEPSHTSFTDEFYCDQDTRANVSRHYYNHSTNPDPSSPPAGTASAYYPNTRFLFDDIPATPIFDVNPTSKDFGTVNQGTTSTAQTFTITNTGGGTLTITSVSKTGTNTDQFTLTDGNTYPHDLGASESITVDVAFAPTTEGAKSAELSVEANAKVTHTAALTGTGFDPYISSFPYTQNFDGVATPNLPANWSKLDDTGGNIDSYVITTDIHSISSPNSAILCNESAITGNLMLISPPASLSVTDTRVKFWCRTSYGDQNIIVGTMSDPTDATTFTELETVAVNGTYTQYTVNITSKSKDDTYISFKHGMDGIYDYFYIDDFTWEEIPTTPIFAIDPESKDFGTVNLGTTSTAQTFTISNTGGGTLTITSVSKTGTNTDQFTLTDGNTYPHDLGAGESITVDVVFAPTSTGTKSADLSVESNAKVTHTAALSGTGKNYNYGGGGAAQGGYYFANSTSAASGAPSQPGYSWVDISTSGTDVSGTVNSDNAVGGPYDIGFTFNYFGTDYTQFYICADGYISLVEETSSAYTNDPIPDSGVPNGMICLLWDDMNPGDTSVTGYHLYYGSSGGNMVISYVRMPDYGASTEDDQFTAQAILYPSGNIKLQYKEFGSSFDLIYCTVGIENAAGDAGVQYLYNGTGGEIYSGAKAGEIAVMFGTDENTLPVELIAGSLTAQFATENNYNFVNLAWSTASETDLQGFNVYRASTIDLSMVNQVNVRLIPGAGNSTETQEYSFADITADVYVNSYYWLEMVDLDGNSFHGPVTYNPQEQEIPENIETTILRNCQPNPVRDEVSIAYQIKGSSSEQNAELRVYNIQGRLVKTVNSDNGIFEFSTSNLSTGIYFYQLKNESFNQIRKMVITK